MSVIESPIPSLEEINQQLSASAEQLKTWEKKFRDENGLDADFLKQVLNNELDTNRGPLRLNVKLTTILNQVIHDVSVNTNKRGGHPTYHVSFVGRGINSGTLGLVYTDPDFLNLSEIGIGTIGDDRSTVSFDPEGRINRFWLGFIVPQFGFDYHDGSLKTWEAAMLQKDKDIHATVSYRNGSAFAADVYKGRSSTRLVSPNLESVIPEKYLTVNPIGYINQAPKHFLAVKSQTD